MTFFNSFLHGVKQSKPCQSSVCRNSRCLGKTEKKGGMGGVLSQGLHLCLNDGGHPSWMLPPALLNQPPAALTIWKRRQGPKGSRHLDTQVVTPPSGPCPNAQQHMSPRHRQGWPSGPGCHICQQLAFLPGFLDQPLPFHYPHLIKVFHPSLLVTGSFSLAYSIEVV